MHTHRKALLTSLAFGGMALTGAAPAAAAPEGEIVVLHCEALGTVEVVVFSNGRSSPGLVVGTNQVLIPYALRIEATFTPHGGEPESFTDEYAHPAPRNGRVDSCTFHQQGVDEFGSFVLDGVAEVSYTPTR